jgi:hypothetical protein
MLRNPGKYTDEPEFVNVFRIPEQPMKPGGPVRQIGLSYRQPASLGIDSS